jgi:hypothetical protein
VGGIGQNIALHHSGGPCFSTTYACLPRSKYKKVNKYTVYTRAYRTAQYCRSVSSKGTEKTTGKIPFLLHLGQRYSPRICNTSGTSASHLQHFWHKCFLIYNIPGKVGVPCATFSPLQHPTNCLCSNTTCNISAVSMLLQHLCIVGTPATPLLQLVPPATSLQCIFRNSVEHQQQQLDLPDARR